MNKNLVKVCTLFAAFVLSVGVATSIKNSPLGLEATQYASNYDYYKYSGSYYSTLTTTGTDGLNGTFRKALTTYIYPKGWYIYGGGGSDHLSGVLQDADQDPTNSSNMVYLYTRDSVKKSAATVDGTMIWNREHVWPQSLSINNGGTQCWGTEEAGTDILHLRPTEETTNSTRGNKIYADVNKANPQKYNGMLYGYISGNYFEPLDEVKGDVARILMYVWTAYTDHYSGLNVTKTIANYDTLLKWHTMDQPDAMEGHRNDYCVTSKQKNRNPFVDHPEYAWRIFGDSCSASVKNDCMAAYPSDGNWTPGGSGSSSSNPSSSAQHSSAAASSTNTVAGTYNVTFKANSDDGTAALSTSEVFSNQISSNTLIKSIDVATKVYPGKNGVKLGSSGAVGEIKFTLLDGVRNNIESIDIESSKYSSDTGSLILKMDDTVISDSITPGVDYHKDLNKASATTISISTSLKRAYLSKVTITVSGSSSGSSSSAPISSSSEQPSSSSAAQSSAQSSSQQASSSSAVSSSSEQSSIPASSNPDVSSNQSSAVSSEQESSTQSTAESSEQSVINTSSEQNNTTSNNDNNGNSDKEKPGLFGCNGSLAATASILGFSALAGLIFVFSKKKHN